MNKLSRTTSRAVCLAGAVLASAASQAQAVKLYDQIMHPEGSLSEISGWPLLIRTNAPLGQSFLPTLPEVGFIELYLSTHEGQLGAQTETISVWLREDTITGKVLGESDPVTVTYTPLVRLLTVTTNLAGAVDVDYHPPTNSLIVSVNFDDGWPNNFDRVDSNGAVTPWSGVSSSLGEIPMTTAKTNANGFTAGETFYSPGVDLGRISPDGTTNTCPWAHLDIYSWAATGLHIDQTGVFGGDLIVVGCNYDSVWPPDNGAVWRIPGTNAPGTTNSNPLAAINTYLEGVLTCPNDSIKYGTNWAGKMLIGGAFSNAVFAVDLAGNVTQTPLGFGPQDLHIIPTNQDFYSINYHPKYEAPTILTKLARDFFVNLTDDFIMIQSGEWSPPGQDQPQTGDLFLVHWDGAAFKTIRITDDEPRILEHGVFTTLSLGTEP